MAWTHVANTGGTTAIYYDTRLVNGTWQNASQITNLGGTNQFPSIVQLSNGTIFVFWAYKATTSSHYQIYSRHLKNSVWTSYSPLPLQNPTPLNDTQPSTAVGSDGILWLLWTRDNSTLSGTTPVMRQLWYETMNSTGWSKNEQSITLASDSQWNFQPSVVVGNDNVPRAVFSRGQSSIFQINYIQYSTTGWATPRSIDASNSTADDMNPSMVQDRNGTFWVFWTRDMGTNFGIRAENSLNNGSTWSIDSLLTAACSGCAESEYAAAVQSNTTLNTDKNIYVVYSTNSGVTGFALYTLVTLKPISPVHRVVIAKSLGTYGANASLIYAGGFHNPYAFISQSAVVLLQVTIQNLGDFAENVTVTMSATNTTSYPLGTQIFLIAIGNQAVVNFSWNTTNVKPARFGFSANATIPVETLGNLAGASLAKMNVVHLLPLGDVDQDGSDTLTDVSVVFYNYGFGCSAPGVCSSRYNPWADPSGQGIINIVDVGIVSRNFDILT